MNRFQPRYPRQSPVSTFIVSASIGVATVASYLMILLLAAGDL